MCTAGSCPWRWRARKQLLVLALLVAQRGRRVSRNALSEALWPARPTAESVHALELQISRLRNAIGADSVVTDNGATTASICLMRSSMSTGSAWSRCDSL